MTRVDDLRTSFGAAASSYDTHRPDYAAAAIAWTLELAPGRDVLDLGAGTGKLTAGLLGHGCSVVAVEPDPAMLAELRTVAPDVAAARGSAERIPLADASVDAVVSGNAMHWFDMAVAGPEIARVLRPGGVLAGLWNVFDDRVPWVVGLARVSGEEAVGARDLRSTWRTATAGILEAAGPAFRDDEVAEFPHVHARDAQALVATLATKAGVLVMPDDQRSARLEQVDAYLRQTPETAGSEFGLPLVTGVRRRRLA